RSGEGLHPVRMTLPVMRRALADQQSHFMPARRQVVDQLRTEPASREVCEPPHLIERFISRAGGHNALHKRRTPLHTKFQHEISNALVGASRHTPREPEAF